MSPKNGSASATQVSGDEQKMNKIVDEVDRFFKSVHADIEDWKFSMEDYGDGTRIFVRFQIHINSSGNKAPPERVTVKVPTLSPPHDTAIAVSIVPGGRTLPDGREVTEDIHEPDGTGAARRADQDLASFVEVWRGKQENKMGGEFHKPGAPFMEAHSDWKGHTRTTAEVSPEMPAERTEEPPADPPANS
jgi:hypothetical protein